MVKKKGSWKDKNRYTVLAPEIFNSQEVGTTFSSNSKSVLGRTVNLSLSNLTGDKARQPVRILLEISDVEGNKAKTKFDMGKLNLEEMIDLYKSTSDKINQCKTYLSQNY